MYSIQIDLLVFFKSPMAENEYCSIREMWEFLGRPTKIEEFLRYIYHWERNCLLFFKSEHYSNCFSSSLNVKLGKEVKLCVFPQNYWKNIVKTERFKDNDRVKQEFLQSTFSDRENFKFPAMELRRYTDHKITLTIDPLSF